MRILFYFFLILFSTQLWSQELNWYKHIYSEGRDYVMGTTSDSDGNIYTIGFYSESGVNIDGTILPYAETMDSYIAKFSKTGDLLWTTALTGIGLFDRVEEIVVDENDDIYVISIMQEEFNIGNQKTFNVPADNTQDILLMKLSSEGELIFTKDFGGPASDIAYGMTVYPDEILLTGHFNDIFYAGLDSIVSNGRQDMLLVSLDKTGELNWMRGYGGASQERLYRAERLVNGNIVVCGYSTGNFEFGETTNTNTQSFFHGFIGLIGPNGDPIRAQEIIPTELSSSFRTFQILNNKIYAIANLGDSSFLNGQYYGKHQHKNLLVAQLNDNLDYSWVRSIESNNDTSSIFSYGMTAYSDKIWIPAFYKGQVDIAGNPFSSETNHAVFFTLDKKGHINNIADLNSGGSQDLTHIHFTKESLTVGSVIRGEYLINGETIQASNSDNLLLNYDLSTLVHTPDEPKIKELILFPNPAQDFIRVAHYQEEVEQVLIYDQQGRLVKNQAAQPILDIQNLMKGVYYLKVVGPDLTAVAKFIKQ